jgi:hypothetical protein
LALIPALRRTGAPSCGKIRDVDLIGPTGVSPVEKQQQQEPIMDWSGGYLWALIDVIGVAVLAAALIYGIMRWRNRPKSPGVQVARDRATDRIYEQQK